MFFLRKYLIEHGAKKALEESGVQYSSYGDYFKFIKNLEFLKSLDASRYALSQSMQSICFAFATLDLMLLRCRLHGQQGNIYVIEQAMSYLAEALEFQISVSKNPEHSRRTADVLVSAVMEDANRVIKESLSHGV